MCKAIHLNIELSIVSRKLKNIPFLIRCESLHWLLNHLNIKWILDYSFSIFFFFICLFISFSVALFFWCVKCACSSACSMNIFHDKHRRWRWDEFYFVLVFFFGKGMAFCCRLLFVGGVCQAGDSMPKGMCDTLKCSTDSNANRLHNKVALHNLWEQEVQPPTHTHTKYIRLPSAVE